MLKMCLLIFSGSFARVTLNRVKLAQDDEGVGWVAAFRAPLDNRLTLLEDDKGGESDSLR